MMMYIFMYSIWDIFIFAYLYAIAETIKKLKSESL